MRRLQHNTSSSTSLIGSSNLSSSLRHRSTTKKMRTWHTSSIERDQAHASHLRNHQSTVQTNSNYIKRAASGQQGETQKNVLRFKLLHQQTIADFIECLEQEDVSGYRGSPSPNEDEVLGGDENSVSSSNSMTSTQSVSLSAATDLTTFGPISTAELLPWLSAPGGRKTYINSIEVAAGRKEMWHKTVTDLHRKRQLVDSMWMYICDAEAQAKLVETQALKQYVGAKRNSDEFKYWIKRMEEKGVEEFFNWPDPNESSVAERREAMDNTSGASSMTMMKNRDGTTTASEDELAQGDDDDDLSMQDQQQLDAKLLSRLKRKNDRQAAAEGLSKKQYQALSGDISQNTPLAPYEDLPFLKMRMQEDPTSLDPSLKEWAEKNLDLSSSSAEEASGINKAKGNNTGELEEEEDNNNEDGNVINSDSEATATSKLAEGEEESPQLRGGSDDEDVVKSVSKTPSPEERARRGLARKLRQSEILNRVYMKTRKRVKKNRVTYDDEGVYFHVMPSTMTSVSNEHDASNTSSTGFDDDSNDSTDFSSNNSSTLDSIIHEKKFSSSTKKSMEKSFFKPKMVKASHDTSRGVVKIDWPTVRAAYAGKRKTDYSREDQAAARERIIRLCRGEDPDTL